MDQIYHYCSGLTATATATALLVRARGECGLGTCRAINTQLGYVQHDHTCTGQMRSTLQSYLLARPAPRFVDVYRFRGRT